MCKQFDTTLYIVHVQYAWVYTYYMYVYLRNMYMQFDAPLSSPPPPTNIMIVHVALPGVLFCFSIRSQE